MQNRQLLTAFTAILAIVHPIMGAPGGFDRARRLDLNINPLHPRCIVIRSRLTSCKVYSRQAASSDETFAGSFVVGRFL